MSLEKICGFVIVRSGILILTLCGCASSGVRHHPPPQAEQRIVLNLQNCTYDFSKFLAHEKNDDIITNFFSALESAALINKGSSLSNGYTITSLQVESSLRTATGGPVVLSLISTPLFPFMFIRSRCTADIKISYVATSPDGKLRLLREQRRRIKGWFAGWSFLRFAFRGKAIAHVSKDIPEVAAEMLLNDIRMMQSAKLLHQPRGNSASSASKSTAPGKS